MIKESRTIFRNTVLLSVTELLARVMSLILIMVVARRLGPELMGVYAFGVAFVGIFQIFVNFGLDPYIQREASRKPETAGKLMAQVFGLKFIIYLVSVILILILGLIVADDEFKRSVVWILTGSMFFQTNLLATNAFFRAFQKAEYEAIVRISLRFIYTGTGILAILSGHGLITLVTLELVAQGTACLVGWSLFIKRISNPFHTLHIRNIQKIISAAWKFALIRVVQTIFNSIDLVMISVMATDMATGLYSCAVRLIGAFDFLPNAFSGAFFPVLSREAVKDRTNFVRVFVPFFKYLLLLGVGIGAIIAGMPKDLITLLFGTEFISAAPALAILTVAMAFTFANWPLSNAIIALDKEHKVVSIFSFCAILNIILNLILIPLMKVQGAAWAAVISRFFLFVLQFSVLIPEIRTSINLYSVIARSVAAGLFSYCFIRFMAPYDFGVAWNLIAATVVFILFSFLTRAIRKQDLVLGRNLISSQQKTRLG